MARLFGVAIYRIRELRRPLDAAVGITDEADVIVVALRIPRAAVVPGVEHKSAVTSLVANAYGIAL